MEYVTAWVHLHSRLFLVSERERWAEVLQGATRERNDQPRRLCELCVELLDVTGAGISLITSAGHRGVVCATNPGAAVIEQLQFSLGEGPCVDAVTGRRPVLVPDLAHPESVAVTRWPAFMSAAAEAGVRAVFAFPLLIGGLQIGALDLYRECTGDLSSQQLTGALLAADAAALALLSLDHGDDATFDDDPTRYGTYHLEVHRATGMVQEQLGVSAGQALVRLRARAFADGRSVTDIARDVVARRLRFNGEDA